MAYISKITIPGGTTYDIKDACAWTEITELWSVINQGALELVVRDSLPDASAGTKGKIYLVSDTTHNPSTNDVYDEYVTVVGGTTSNPTYSWEKIGNTDVNLSDYSHIGHTHTVSGTTDSSGVHTHTVSSVTRYIPAQDKVPLTFTKKDFVYHCDSGSLETEKIYGVSTNTVTASKATAQTAVNVAKPGTEKSYSKITSNSIGAVTVTCTSANTATGSLGTATTERTDDTPMWGASVNDSTETLYFVFKPLSTANRVTGATATTTATVTAYSNSSITGINGSVSYTPYTFSNVTVPIKDTSYTTVATGSISETGTGDKVLTKELSSEAFTNVDTSVSLLKNSPLTNTATNVQVVASVGTNTGSNGGHAHTFSTTTGGATS
jgi:hypothetical protein